MGFKKENLADLAKVALEHKASDIHIRLGESPCLRIRGDLVPVQTNIFNQSDILDVCRIITENENAPDKLEQINEIDGSYDILGVCRFRYNIFLYSGKIGIILRIININIPSAEDLGLPSTINKIANRKRGLIIVTGTTGSGKSTTLAAMINHINKTRTSHIITIEDPIEYIHPQLKSRISQREVGKDTDNFFTGLRSALRQDPDIILIGEMRDTETISTALKAAETGHTVFSTMHTTNAITTIGRIISMFPSEQQEEIKKRLAENLQATIGQRLLKHHHDKGFVVAQEIMIQGPGVKECILGEENLHKIHSIIEHGKGKGGNGSQSFDQHIMELFDSRKISKETAMENVSSQSDFIQKLLVE